jgi:hypothetical protein
VRVCKAWYALACPFLYEHIILKVNGVLAPLRDGLSRAVLENRQAGWWTESLDVRMRDMTDTPETVFATLADILTYLPNLCILTFAITGRRFFPLASPLPNAVLNSITSSGSLRCVQWDNCVSTPLPHHWTAFLQKHPEIEVLDGAQSVELNTPIKLHAVKIVHGYPNEKGHLTGWSMPDLPCVRSMFYNLTYGCVAENDITFSRLGRNLTDIQLDVFEQRYLRIERLDPTFARIRTECTRLTQVVLGVLSWSILSSYTPTLPSTVHTLGIRIMKAQVSAAKVKRLFDTLLPSYVACNPSLKTIKFLEAKNVRALRSHRISLSYGLRVMENLGVVIKDLEDRLIAPPSCPGVIYLQQQLDTPSSTSTLDDHHPTS